MKRLFQKFTSLIYPTMIGYAVASYTDTPGMIYFFLLCHILFWMGLIGQTCILGSEHRKSKNIDTLEELFGTYFKMVTPTFLGFAVLCLPSLHPPVTRSEIAFVEDVLPITTLLLFLFALTGIVGTIVVECKINRKRKKEIAAQPDKQEDTAE